MGGDQSVWTHKTHGALSQLVWGCQGAGYRAMKTSAGLVFLPNGPLTSVA